MTLRRLFGIGDKDHTESDATLKPTAILDVQNGGKFPIQDVATIGRAPESHIVLNDHSVSRHHARIFYEAGHYWLKDLDSANGTALNGKKASLQMLKDNDKIAFGEVKAVFCAPGEKAGPASIGRDPLEGSDLLSQAGTPTGGMGKAESSASENRILRGLKNEVGAARKLAADKEKEVQSLQNQINALKRENESLRGELAQRQSMEAGSLPAPSTPVSSDSLERENERLRKLTKQLERALADANLRLRNMQELLGQKRN